MCAFGFIISFDVYVNANILFDADLVVLEAVDADVSLMGIDVS